MARRRDISHDANNEELFSDLNWAAKLTPMQLPKLLDEMQGSINRIDLGYRNALYNRLAAVAGIAAYLSQHSKAWDKFCDHPAWEKAKRKKPKRESADNALAYVMRFSVGFGTAHDKTASRYRLAIEHLLASGCTPKELPVAIENAGGIVALIDGGDSKDSEDVPDDDNAEEGDEGAVEKVRTRKGKPRTPYNRPKSTTKRKPARGPADNADEGEDAEDLDSDDDERSPANNDYDSSDEFVLRFDYELKRDRLMRLSKGDRVRLTFDVTEMTDTFGVLTVTGMKILHDV